MDPLDVELGACTYTRSALDGGAVITGDEYEPVLVHQNVQPVPSMGLLDDPHK